jgi:hypothetical protein
MKDNDDGQWHLDKKVPLALILAILLQTAAAVWWASSIGERVNQLERQSAMTAPQAERIVRLETKVDAIFSSLTELKQLIQRPH